MTNNESHEVRELRWKVKQLGRQLGKAGDTIHTLRAELAQARAIQWITPGSYDRLVAQLHASNRDVDELEERLKELENK
jgi:predicted RNase H-like nuclease (RuvC/YqgF family)